MEINFSPEQEAKLARMAAEAGTSPEQWLKDAALNLLEEKARFLSAVEEGLAAAERGEFIEEEEMDARVERMLKR
jgi:predicted transcriptional regulator